MRRVLYRCSGWVYIFHCWLSLVSFPLQSAQHKVVIIYSRYLPSSHVDVWFFFLYGNVTWVISESRKKIIMHGSESYFSTRVTRESLILHFPPTALKLCSWAAINVSIPCSSFKKDFQPTFIFWWSISVSGFFLSRKCGTKCSWFYINLTGQYRKRICIVSYLCLGFNVLK